MKIIESREVNLGFGESEVHSFVWVHIYIYTQGSYNIDTMLLYRGSFEIQIKRSI